MLVFGIGFPLSKHIVVLPRVKSPNSRLKSSFGFLARSASEHKVEYANQWSSPFLSRNRFQCPIVHTFLWSALQGSKALDAFGHTPDPDFLHVNWFTQKPFLEPNFYPKKIHDSWTYLSFNTYLRTLTHTSMWNVANLFTYYIDSDSSAGVGLYKRKYPSHEMIINWC